jgi:hypothetical protein
MNKTSSFVTGAATVTGGFFVPLIDWVLNTLLHCAAPESVLIIMSASLVTGGHFAVNYFNSKVPQAQQPRPQFISGFSIAQPAQPAPQAQGENP